MHDACLRQRPGAQLRPRSAAAARRARARRPPHWRAPCPRRPRRGACLAPRPPAPPARPQAAPRRPRGAAARQARTRRPLHWRAAPRRPRGRQPARPRWARRPRHPAAGIQQGAPLGAGPPPAPPTGCAASGRCATPKVRARSACSHRRADDRCATGSSVGHAFGKPAAACPAPQLRCLPATVAQALISGGAVCYKGAAKAQLAQRQGRCA